MYFKHCYEQNPSFYFNGCLVFKFQTSNRADCRENAPLLDNRKTANLSVSKTTPFETVYLFFSDGIKSFYGLSYTGDFTVKARQVGTISLTWRINAKAGCYPSFNTPP
jgi:hypothetical protein